MAPEGHAFRHWRGRRRRAACAGITGVQLTWMDAKAGDWVVTPRIGKPVEINALWYNALRIMSAFAQRLGETDPFRVADLPRANQ
jgi:glycogen debranching enzyme